MSTQFAGQGVTLYKSSDSPALEPVWPREARLQSTDYSIPIAVNPALKTMLTFAYDSAPGSDTNILYSNTPTFTDSFILDTIPSGSDTLAVWQCTEPLQGFIRVYNSSGVDINSVTCQQVVSTSWS
jgi:hypothetical protein